MSELIADSLVRLDVDLGGEKQEVIRALAGLVADTERCTDPDGLAADALARERLSATGLPGGIAIPHCRSGAVVTSTVAFARLTRPVDFGAADGAADLVFLLATPHHAADAYLPILTKLARALVIPAFVDGLRASRTPQDVVVQVTPVIGR